VARPISPNLKRRHDTFQQALGMIVTMLRTGRKWSQQQLADKIGYNVTYLNGLEQGTRNPSLELVLALAHVFGLKPSQLFARTERLVKQ
jgi:transcriptional regulator with XRE-family HTH domain